MARNERQEDDGRGGVSTIARPGARRRPATVPPPATVPRPARWAGRPAGHPGNAQAAPSVPSGRAAPGGQAPPTVLVPPAQSAPTAHPAPNVQAAPSVLTAPSARPALRPGAAAAAAAARPGSHRLPFVLLLCGLLGGALICALVISTTLAEGAFQITNLQNSTTVQAKQLQSLQEQVAQAQSAQQIATRATKLGMVGVGQLRFLDLKTGKTTTDANPGFVGNIPGYYP